MTDGNMEKSAIRRAMKLRRAGVASGEKAAAEADVFEKLKALTCAGGPIDPFRCDSPVAVYLASPAEICIDSYVMYLIGEGVKTVAPRWNGVSYDLALLKGLDGGCVRRGPMGIREPADAATVPAREVCAWIIPGLAFTPGGKRLGYGGGWYDRFLASAPESAVKIGVAYQFQMVADLPDEPHDIPLTRIVAASAPDGRTRRPCPVS